VDAPGLAAGVDRIRFGGDVGRRAFGGPESGNALVDSPNRQAYRADQALAFVALKDDLEEGLVVAVVGREILEFVEHDKFGGA
jgi:hypothetical protein